MDKRRKEDIKRHIATHTVRSAEDRSAVSYLESVINPGGRINTAFSCDDKWPNHDGSFEYVSNPDLSRYPKQNFIVQIKGTHNYGEKDGVITYCLQSLSFPAFIANDVTADPGILFVILDPDVRNNQRIYWKHMSKVFLNEIDFSKDSKTIYFYPEDEIKNTDESMDVLCEKLNQIIDAHVFLNKLDPSDVEKEEALRIMEYQCGEVSKCIDILKENPNSRDEVSRRIVRDLYDLCYAALILNAYKNGYSDVSEKLAWEVSQLTRETRYLCDFLKGLKYINHRIPKEGQAERLMLKYYNYLWEIRRFMKRSFRTEVLSNLELFPLDLDRVDMEYYKSVAGIIENADLTPKNVRVSRYYIQRISPFFVEGERYYEITLQLAGKYSTKYNRVTIYSKMTVSTNYSIQIAYTEAEIKLWGVKNSIKILNDWKVAIDPSCLNKLSKMVLRNTKINRNYGEYNNLMKFLTETGMNLFELVNMREEQFREIYNKIFGSTNTHDFGDTLKKIQGNYSKSSIKTGKNTIGYAMLHMREEILEDLLPNQFYGNQISVELYISRRCYPFEKNPLISNLVGTKSSKSDKESIMDLFDNADAVALARPYMMIEGMINDTGELLFEKARVSGADAIKRYNDSLDQWEKDNGYSIIEKNGLVCIAAYFDTTISILKCLKELSHDSDREQLRNNERFLKKCEIKFDDPVKEIALRNSFVNSNLMLIYGAAGTGKTKLISYITDMMTAATKLYLTKTHTALQNIKRHLENRDDNCSFETVDGIAQSKSMVNFDIVFVDECSTIDNRTMEILLGKIHKGTKLVLSGDIYQIESIDFGNWFFYAKDIIKSKGANVELSHTWRTEKEELKSLWNAVREKSILITEKLSMDGPFSEDLGENIFRQDGDADEDEVVLCLNYDGKFGLNNMNRYFQNANNLGKVYSWEEWTFKKGDRIIFTNTKRSPLLYNNLKGTIVDIEYGDRKIIFEIEVKAYLTEKQCENESFDYIGQTGSGTLIRIDIISWDDELSEEDKIKTVIPFQLAYAVSIHKAQGLEYKSVKVVIPPSNAEKITHSIFYTAITRAKEKLKIYWSPETMKPIIGSFIDESVEHRTLPIIKEELCKNESTDVF